MSRSATVFVQGVAAAVAVAVAVVGPWAGVASAEVGWPTPTAQAVAMESEFLIDPAYPPAIQTAVCEIDSGVADSAVGEFGPGLLDRYTMQEGDPVTDTHDQQHGTWMARYMGAARDGIGMVGIWPGVRIVSVRALVGTGQMFPFQRYTTAIAACVRLRGTGVPIVAISLSLGGAFPSGADVARLVNSVGDARAHDISVFAAAGNEPGPVASPAREEGVVGVAAGGARPDEAHGRFVGQPCFGSAGETPSLEAGRDLIAPGCFLEAGTPDGQLWSSVGSSQATAMAASLYAAGRAYNPSLTGEAAEFALLSSSRQYDGWVSARRFFAAANIDWQALARPLPPVDPQSQAAVPPGGEPWSAPTVGADQPAKAVASLVARRYVAPKLALRKRSGRILSIAVAKHTLPQGASLYLRALDGRRRSLVKRSSHGAARIVVSLPYGTRFVDVRYRTEVGATLDSRPVEWKTTVRRSTKKPHRPPRDREFRWLG